MDDRQKEEILIENSIATVRDLVDHYLVYVEEAIQEIGKCPRAFEVAADRFAKREKSVTKGTLILAMYAMFKSVESLRFRRDRHSSN
jgi:hypothetical protein